MDLNLEQQRALALLESGVNVFLTGKAGSGKSTVVREFIRRNRAAKSIVTVAPTGIAALQVDGCTIHHFFEIPINMESLEKLEEFPLSHSRLETLRYTDVIIVDEISMVRSDLFSALYRRLQQADRENLLQLIVVGDFQQLPPIVSDPAMREYLEQEYQGTFAFETKAWAKLNLSVSVLRCAHRQQGEENEFFLRVLNSMRCFWNHEQFYAPLSPFKQLNLIDGILSPPSDDVTRLCVYRRDAAKWNSDCIAALPGPERMYSAVIVDDMPPEDYPVPQKLCLKIGMRVMLRVNLYDEYGNLTVGNGDIGKVEKLADGYVNVYFERTQQSRTILPHVWNLVNYEVKFDQEEGKYCLNAVKLGSFQQIPLIPGYALTVHRAQGMSLSAMLFDRGRGCFECGQLYTALSRCRFISQLHLASPVLARDLKFNPKLARFCEELELEPDLLLTAMVNCQPPKRWTQFKLISFLREVLLTYRVSSLNPPTPEIFENIPEEERIADARELYALCHNYQPDQKRTVLTILRKYRAARAQRREEP